LKRVPAGFRGLLHSHGPDGAFGTVTCQARRVLSDNVRGWPEANARTESHEHGVIVLRVLVLLRAWQFVIVAGGLVRGQRVELRFGLHGRQHARRP